jgi:hypothetical protein
MMCRLKTVGDNEEIIAPLFTLPELRTGQSVSIAAFRQRQPVGLLLVPDAAAAEIVVQHASEWLDRFRESQSALAVVVRRPITVHYPEPLQVLIDNSGSVFERYDCPVDTAVCVYGLDRFGAVVYRATCTAYDLPAAFPRLLDAIELSEMQCPECGV